MSPWVNYVISDKDAAPLMCFLDTMMINVYLIHDVIQIITNYYSLPLIHALYVFIIFQELVRQHPF